MTEVIELRRGVIADAEAIRELTRGAYAKWVSVIGCEPIPMVVDYDQAIRKHRFDLMYVEGKLVALIETTGEADHLLVVNVAVACAQQGRGFGRKLLAHAESIAAYSGLREIRLYTNKLFAENLRLYASLGYKVDREEEHAVGTRVHMSKLVTMIELPAAAEKVRTAAAAAGLAIDIKVMAQSTRTAEEAARACACSVAEIVKSLVFRGAVSGGPILLLVSGSHRVNEALVSEAIGEAIERPDADYVREVTGFAIGGIPPFGHVGAMATFIDETLFDYDKVWAAAGTPKALFSVSPAALQQATGAKRIPVE